MPRSLHRLLTRRYPATHPSGYLVSPIRLQTDGYNCAPWVVEILKELVEHDRLPADGFNIDAARTRHQAILKDAMPVDAPGI